MADPRGMGVWTDNAYTDGAGYALTEKREFVQENRPLLGDVLYFGGVAFKYQTPSEDVKKSSEAATPYVDVITTSGAGTGIAASEEEDRIDARRRR